MTQETENLLFKLALLGGGVYIAYVLIIEPAGNVEQGVSNAVSTVAQDLGLSADPNAAAVATATTNITGSAFDPNFYNTPGAGPTILTASAATDFATTIYNALDTWFFNDFNAVWGVFTQLTTKSQVSFLANVFQGMYNSNLLSWLEYANGNSSTAGSGSLLGGGLSDTQVEQIITYVNQLPNT
jgi:hypothetical protein